MNSSKQKLHVPCTEIRIGYKYPSSAPSDVNQFFNCNMRAIVLLLLVAVASARVYDRCELARKLKAAGMDGHGASLSDCE